MSLEIACKIERTEAIAWSFVPSHVVLRAQREKQNQSALLTLQSGLQYSALKWKQKMKISTPNSLSLSGLFSLTSIIPFLPISHSHTLKNTLL